ncbi:MAG: hypothetical protein Q9190_000959 [Brigantiaea leucoxantha]
MVLSDVSWTAQRVGIWVIVECNIGIVSACLPILRPLFTTKYPSSPASFLSRFFRTIVSTVRSNSHSQGGGSSSNGTSQRYRQSRKAVGDVEKGDGSSGGRSPDFVPSPTAAKWGSDSTIAGTFNAGTEGFGDKARRHANWYRALSFSNRAVREREEEGDDDESWREVVNRQPWPRSESPASFRSDRWNLMPSKKYWRRGLMQ